MLGTIVNTLSIMCGSIVGKFVRNGIPDRFNNIIMNGLALCIIYIGISGSLKAENILIMIISMVIGGIIGEVLDIDEFLNKCGKKLEVLMKNKNGKLAQGFVSASLLYCVGAMAIIGSLESGLNRNYKILFTKSILDGISSIVLTASLGIGVFFSAFAVLLYQGIMTIAAVLLKSILVESAINDMTAVGSLLIIGLGFNMLQITKIKIANLLPAIFLPVLYYVFI